MSFKPVKIRDYGTSKGVISRLFKQAGGVPAVMELLGLSRTRVYAFADPNEQSQISYDRVVTVTRETGATAAAEQLAHLAGGVFLPVEPSETDPDWHQIAARASTRSADSISNLMRSLSPESATPGEITAEEAHVLIEKVDRQFKILALKRQMLVEIVNSDGPSVGDS